MIWASSNLDSRTFMKKIRNFIPWKISVFLAWNCWKKTGKYFAFGIWKHELRLHKWHKWLCDQREKCVVILGFRRPNAPPVWPTNNAGIQMIRWLRYPIRKTILCSAFLTNFRRRVKQNGIRRRRGKYTNFRHY